MDKSEIETSDVNHAAWLAANGVPFVRADASRGPRVKFIFDDAAGRADRLLGALVRDEVLTAFTVYRGRFAGLLRALRDRRRSGMSAEEFHRLRGR